MALLRLKFPPPITFYRTRAHKCNVMHGLTTSKTVTNRKQTALAIIIIIIIWRMGYCAGCCVFLVIGPFHSIAYVCVCVCVCARWW